MRHRHAILGSLAALLFSAACSNLAPDGDGADDAAIGGKADDAYSQCQIAAVVKYLNQDLDPADMVANGINQRAANKLAAYRAGSDGLPGTEDDRLFATIAEVDAVPYVGPVTLAQLVDASGDRCGSTELSIMTLIPEGEAVRNVDLPFSNGAYFGRPEHQMISVEASTLPDLTCYEQDSLSCATLRVQLPPDARPGIYECSTEGVELSAELASDVFYPHDAGAWCKLRVVELGADEGSKILIADIEGELFNTEGTSLQIESAQIATRRGPDVIGD